MRGNWRARAKCLIERRKLPDARRASEISEPSPNVRRAHPTAPTGRRRVIASISTRCTVLAAVRARHGSCSAVPGDRALSAVVWLARGRVVARVSGAEAPHVHTRASRADRGSAMKLPGVVACAMLTVVGIAVLGGEATSCAAQEPTAPKTAPTPAKALPPETLDR